MNKLERSKIIKDILDELYPSVPIPLNHSDPFTLLIAVLLSAQCTDERVNMVTPALFKIGPTPKKMAKRSVSEILECSRLLQRIEEIESRRGFTFVPHQWNLFMQQFFALKLV